MGRGVVHVDVLIVVEHGWGLLWLAVSPVLAMAPYRKSGFAGPDPSVGSVPSERANLRPDWGTTF